MLRLCFKKCLRVVEQEVGGKGLRLQQSWPLGRAEAVGVTPEKGVTPLQSHASLWPCGRGFSVEEAFDIS